MTISVKKLKYYNRIQCIKLQANKQKKSTRKCPGDGKAVLNVVVAGKLTQNLFFVNGMSEKRKINLNNWFWVKYIMYRRCWKLFQLSQFPILTLPIGIWLYFGSDGIAPTLKLSKPVILNWLLSQHSYEGEGGAMNIFCWQLHYS